MLAEWGVNEGTNNPAGKAAFFDGLPPTLKQFPAIKALAYFDEDKPPMETDMTTTPDSSATSLAAFRRLCDWASSIGPAPVYARGSVEASST